MLAVNLDVTPRGWRSRATIGRRTGRRARARGRAGRSALRGRRRRDPVGPTRRPTRPARRHARARADALAVPAPRRVATSRRGERDRGGAAASRRPTRWRSRAESGAAPDATARRWPARHHDGVSWVPAAGVQALLVGECARRPGRRARRRRAPRRSRSVNYTEAAEASLGARGQPRVRRRARRSRRDERDVDRATTRIGRWSSPSSRRRSTVAAKWWGSCWSDGPDLRFAEPTSAPPRWAPLATTATTTSCSGRGREAAQLSDYYQRIFARLRPSGRSSTSGVSTGWSRSASGRSARTTRHGLGRWAPRGSCGDRPRGRRVRALRARLTMDRDSSAGCCARWRPRVSSRRRPAPPTADPRRPADAGGPRRAAAARRSQRGAGPVDPRPAGRRPARSARHRDALGPAPRHGVAGAGPGR